MKGMIMSSEIKEQLEKELDKYLKKEIKFLEYYPGMNVLSSTLYKKQLEDALEFIKNDTEVDASSFKLYLDTIIVNMHTKIKKYKKSIYFDNENIKDIQNQGFTIVFYRDEKENFNILLGIVKIENVI